MKLHIKTTIAGVLCMALASFATAKQCFTDEPKPLQMPDGFVFSSNNYPVTICGTVEATSKDPKSSNYILKNNSLEVWLRVRPTIDSMLRVQFDSLSGIYPYGAADGCLSGLHLPISENDKTIFEVESGAIAIAPGGISVSN